VSWLSLVMCIACHDLQLLLWFHLMCLHLYLWKQISTYCKFLLKSTYKIEVKKKLIFSIVMIIVILTIINGYIDSIFSCQIKNAQYCMDIDRVTIEYFVKVKQMKIDDTCKKKHSSTNWFSSQWPLYYQVETMEFFLVLKVWSCWCLFYENFKPWKHFDETRF
jgi:hypothetical protein